MSFLVRRSVFAGACAAASACTMLTGIGDLGVIEDTDASGQDASVPDSPAGDAVSEPAPAIIDGGGDACAGEFCDDFDETALGARWTTTVVDGGALMLDTASVTSAPNAFRVTTPAGPDNVIRRAYLTKTFPVPSSITCTFMMRLNASTAASVRYVDLFEIIAVGPQIPRYLLRWGAHGASSALREDVIFSDGGCACPRKDQDFAGLPVGQWMRVTLSTNFTQATVSYDGGVVYSSTFVGFTPTSLAVVLGTDHKDAIGTNVSFDDFVCDTAP